MSELHLHIISFDIPYPANYGGVIDVFYKIRALYEAGVKIHLHCFKYHRQPAAELEKYCCQIHYYPRKTGFLSAISYKPYIVYSRRSKELLYNLCKDNYPILFEGLHSCYYLSHKKLQDRIRIYRESNIEHHYYFHLFKAERNPLKKIYFIFSSLKLWAFQKALANATMMLTVSKEDNAYLASRFPGVRVEYIPSFHRDTDINIIPGTGNFILYQGNLSVAENIKAAEYLVTEVFSKSEHTFVIAGLNPPEKLLRLSGKYKNVKLIPNPSFDVMDELIRTAQVNLMVTFQPTGLKLKLLYALFNGRHCVINQEMVTGTELGILCTIGNTASDLKQKVDELMTIPFDEVMISSRRELLMKWHSNKENCISLLNFVSLLYTS